MTRESRIQRDIKQRRPFASRSQEATVALLRTADMVRREIRRLVEPHGITLQQFNVLRILRGAHPGGYPRGEIATRMIDRAPDVTRLIDRLERQGLVERALSGADRRQSMAVITGQGLDLLSRIGPAVTRAQKVIGRRLSANDLRQLSRICERIYGPAAQS